MKRWIPAFAGLTMMASSALAADYYIYKDARGVVTIGNRPPPADAVVVKHYDLPEASDAEIARTARDNSAIAARNFERERLVAAERLATEVARLNAAARAPMFAEAPLVTEISIVNEARRFERREKSFERKALRSEARPSTLNARPSMLGPRSRR